MFLSVVAPCFNESGGLRDFHRRVTDTCRTVLAAPARWELVLVNDGSRDGTLAMMHALAAEDPHVVVVNLARNYGHQIALTAGLQQCRGDRVLILDADLQDPPELLGPMMDLMDTRDADVVYGQRRKRAGETAFKRTSAKLFYRLMRRLVDIDIPLDTGDFRLMNRRTLDVLNAMPEQHRFIRGMVSWIGLRQLPFPYDRDPRFAGETGYPLLKMIRFSLDAITGFSVVPLRIASVAGAFTGAMGFLTLLYSMFAWATGRTVEGWTSLATLILILGGAQLLMLGVFGEYLGRLYTESKRRPLFVIESVVCAPAPARAFERV
jgi:dolichol-phosphate mannosyltransferase